MPNHGETPVTTTSVETVDESAGQSVSESNTEASIGQKLETLATGDEQQDSQKPESNADVGLSLDELISKQKRKAEPEKVADSNPVDMMQKMMAMMSGQIPMVGYGLWTYF